MTVDGNDSLVCVQKFKRIWVNDVNVTSLWNKMLLLKLLVYIDPFYPLNNRGFLRTIFILIVKVLIASYQAQYFER